MKVTLEQAKMIIKEGGIIAYPTETTFGLGCCASNEKALQKLNQIKQRSPSKGFIALIANYKQLETLAAPLTKEQMQAIKLKWPGPHTFVFPCHANASRLLTGNRDTIAIRMSSHPIAKALSKGQSITSTSANISNQAVLNNASDIASVFGDLIDGIIDAPPGNLPPSSIIDAITGHRYR